MLTNDVVSFEQQGPEIYASKYNIIFRKEVGVFIRGGGFSRINIVLIYE